MKMPLNPKLKAIIDIYNAGYDNETLNFMLDQLDKPAIPPVASEAESLLKRALQAVNTAKRFKFAVFDDSYKLASDIESYLKRTNT